MALPLSSAGRTTAPHSDETSQPNSRPFSGTSLPNASTTPLPRPVDDLQSGTTGKSPALEENKMPTASATYPRGSAPCSSGDSTSYLPTPYAASLPSMLPEGRTSYTSARDP